MLTGLGPLTGNGVGASEPKHLALSKQNTKSLPEPELTARTKSRCSPRWSAFHYAISWRTYRCVSNPHLRIMRLGGLCRVSSHDPISGQGRPDRRGRLCLLFISHTYIYKYIHTIYVCGSNVNAHPERPPLSKSG